MQSSRNPFGGLRLVLLVVLFSLAPLGFTSRGVDANRACAAGTGSADDPCVIEIDSICLYNDLIMLDRYLKETP